MPHVQYRQGMASAMPLNTSLFLWFGFCVLRVDGINVLSMGGLLYLRILTVFSFSQGGLLYSLLRPLVLLAFVIYEAS